MIRLNYLRILHHQKLKLDRKQMIELMTLITKTCGIAVMLEGGDGTRVNLSRLKADDLETVYKAANEIRNRA